MDGRLSRRRLLGAVAAGATASLAGCSDGLGRLGSDGSSDYRKWLPAPETGGGDRYGLLAIDVATAREHETALRNAGMWSEIEAALREDGAILEFERGTVDQYFGGPGEVYTGTFESDMLAEQARNGGFERVGDYRGMELFGAGGDEGYVFAISDDAVVFPGSGGSAAVERIVDARRGDGQRYEDDEAVGPLVDALDLQFYVQAQFRRASADVDGATGYRAGRVGVGYTHDVDGDTTETTWRHLYDARERATEAPIQNWIDRQSRDGGALDGYSGVGVERDRRLVSVSGTVPTADLEWQ